MRLPFLPDPASALDRRSDNRSGGRRVYDWALDWAQFPFHVFDLQGPNGKVAHGKLVPFLAIVCWTLILGAIGIMTRTFPPTGAIIAILTVSFLNAGLFKSFLTSWKGTSSDAVTITHAAAPAPEAPPAALPPAVALQAIVAARSAPDTPVGALVDGEGD